MLDLFSDDARRVVVLADEEARAINWTHIGSEHLLLGMLRAKSTIAGRALRQVGLDLESVRSQTLCHISVGPEATGGQLSFTPRAVEVLTAARREAKDRGHDFIGTGHLLLGLATVGDGLAIRITRELGVSDQQLTDAVDRLLGPGS